VIAARAAAADQLVQRVDLGPQGEVACPSSTQLVAQRALFDVGVAAALLVALATALLVLLGPEGWLGGDRVAHAAPSSISEARCGAVPMRAASRSCSEPPTFASVAI